MPRIYILEETLVVTFENAATNAAYRWEIGVREVGPVNWGIEAC